MKIVVVCDQGNNRSVHFAHLLKYWKHDVIPVGLQTNSRETLDMLYKWADTIIIVEDKLAMGIPITYEEKLVIFDVGLDTYPRPFNPELYQKAKDYLEKNKEWLKL